MIFLDASIMGNDWDGVYISWVRHEGSGVGLSDDVDG